MNYFSEQSLPITLGADLSRGHSQNSAPMIYKTNRLMQKLKAMTRLFPILSIIIFAGLAALAQQRPLLTEDVDITPEGTVEVSAGVDFLQNVKFPLSGLKGDLTRV